MPVQRCQRETTSKDFLRWQIFLEKMESEKRKQEQENNTKQDWYSAAIIASLEKIRLGPKKSKKLKIKECLLKFVPDKKAGVEPELSPEEKARRSKSTWLGMFGFKSDN